MGSDLQLPAVRLHLPQNVAGPVTIPDEVIIPPRTSEVGAVRKMLFRLPYHVDCEAADIVGHGRVTMVRYGNPAGQGE